MVSTAAVVGIALVGGVCADPGNEMIYLVSRRSARAGRRAGLAARVGIGFRRLHGHAAAGLPRCSWRAAAYTRSSWAGPVLLY